MSNWKAVACSSNKWQDHETRTRRLAFAFRLNNIGIVLFMKQAEFITLKMGRMKIFLFINLSQNVELFLNILYLPSS